MKISKNATIGSILFGIILAIFGIIYLININLFSAPFETYSELCMLFGIAVILWGAFMIIFGYLQFRDIQKGKEFEVPGELIK